VEVAPRSARRHGAAPARRGENRVAVTRGMRSIPLHVREQLGRGRSTRGSRRVKTRRWRCGSNATTLRRAAERDFGGQLSSRGARICRAARRGLRRGAAARSARTTGKRVANVEPQATSSRAVGPVPPRARATHGSSSRGPMTGAIRAGANRRERAAEIRVHERGRRPRLALSATPRCPRWVPPRLNLEALRRPMDDGEVFSESLADCQVRTQP